MLLFTLGLPGFGTLQLDEALESLKVSVKILLMGLATWKFTYLFFLPLPHHGKLILIAQGRSLRSLL